MALDRLPSAFPRKIHALRASAAILFAATVGIAAGACSSDEEPIAPPASGGTGGVVDGGGGSGKGGAPDATGAGGASGASGGSSGASGSGGSGGATGGTGGATGGTGGATGGTGGASGAGGSKGGASGSGGSSGTGGAAGSSGSGGTAGTPDAAVIDATSDATSPPDAGSTDATSSDTTSDVTTPRPPCMKKPSQVVVLGDSYVNWISHTFPADLAREAGVTYRMYAVGGTAMGSGGIGLIPPQLDQAVTADPDIIAAVMDGGGNDILVADTAQFPQGADCKQNAMSPTIPDCQKIVQKAVDAAITLMNTAADKGVKDVVYFFYPHVPEGTIVGGAHPNAILDYALPRVKETCDGANTRTGGRLTCHFVDMIPVFDGHPEYFALADIHPNPTGSGAMAKAIWQKMKDKCIAQPASSGCCTP
ncbi:MAG: SGNH/GDSL hydrolase family protein [Polyangiaceae bacterium]